MKTKVFASLSIAALLGSACSGDIKTIDRTQPNAIKKSLFSGIWYYRATIVDSEPYGWDSAVDGYASGLDKLRWDITEDLLIGYRSYEFLPYGEGLTDEGRDFFGAPVVAYRILSHFDIQRDYNPTTGVQTNVLVENTTDRPWHEREYIRVDWSQNVVGSPARFWTGWTSFPDAYYSGTSLVSYYHQDNETTKTNINRPYFTDNYFDVTNDYNIEPHPLICYYQLLYNGLQTCGASRATVRLSFKKIDPTDDYQVLYYPDYRELEDDQGNAIILDYDGRPCDSTRSPAECQIQTFPYFAAFGNIRVMHTVFDRERFLTRGSRMYYAGRFDIWQDSYNDADGSLIPYEQRTPKPMVWYTNADFPDNSDESGKENMVSAAERIGEQWSGAFDETVAALQGLTTDGRGDVAKLREKYGQDFRMFQVKRNSCNIPNVREYVQANDLVDVVNEVAGGLDRLARGNIQETCAAIQWEEVHNRGKSLEEAFNWQREGDLRYNFQNYVEQDQLGPWGVVVMTLDPETGEIPSATGNLFGDANDWIATRETDRVQWLNGDIGEEELLRGDISRRYVRVPNDKPANIHRDVKRGLMEHDKNMLKSAGESLFKEVPMNSETDRFKRMFGGTDIERELLVTDEILRGVAGPTMYQPSNGFAPTSQDAVLPANSPVPGSVSEEAFNKASPVSWGVGLDDNEYFKAFKFFASQGVEFAQFFDPTASALADELKGKPRDEIIDFMRRELYITAEIHEVGHAVGLTHNFGASMDPMNYNEDFWNLYWNNQGDKDNPTRGNEYKYASVMDYGYGFPIEIHGLGPYDHAAIRFMYGELVDVWNPAKVVIPDARKFGSWARRCGHENNWIGMDYMFGILDYMSIPNVLGSVRSSDGRTADQIYQDLIARMEANARAAQDNSACYLLAADINWLMDEVRSLDPRPDLVFGARMWVPAETLINQQRAVLLNGPEYDDPSTQVREDMDGQDQDGDGIPDDKGYGCQLDANGQVTGCYDNLYYKIDYSFCPDEYAGYSPFCQPWDGGADLTEQIDLAVMRYDRDYVFNNFRRDRVDWGNPFSYMEYQRARTFFHMTNVFRYYLYTRRSAVDYPIYDDWAGATYKAINFLERIIQTPEPGTYCLTQDPIVQGTTCTANTDCPGASTCGNGGVCVEDVYMPQSQVTGTCTDQFEVNLGPGAGKYYNTNWTDEYYYKPNIIGTFYDKLGAIRQLTTSSGLFYRDVSDLFDRRSFALPYLRAYEDPIIERFSALIRGDHRGYRSAVKVDPNTGEKLVRYMPFFDEEDPETGASVQQELATLPKIEPAWSWTLQYYALAYAISNFSSINDSSPEFYRFTKISIPGTPEDVEYPASMPLVEFTDDTTQIRYRAPDIEAQSRVQNVVFSDIPRYNRPNSWGIGADLLRQANHAQDLWRDAMTACNGGDQDSCVTEQRLHNRLREIVGFIDIVRRFNKAAETAF